jgi:cellulose synthase/poly-beta-1,6-N-acetylglucosamine synthase-like glycosyltransferase
MTGERTDSMTQPPRTCPSVSVLIAAWNEAERIGDCLGALAAIGWPDLEVLVSAGGTDDTLAIARAHASDRIAVFPQRPGAGKQAALRELLAHARGEIIYLTDGDTIVPEATFRAVLAPIIAGEVQVVTGNYRPYSDSLDAPLTYYQWSIDRAVERRRGPQSEGITGANAAVTRSALDAAGGFDAVVQTGTDYWLARRLRSLGFEIRYVDAGVETEYAKSADLYSRRRSRWLRNTFLHGRRLGDRAEVRSSLIAMGIGAATIGGPITLKVNKWLGSAAWCSLVAMLLMRRVAYANALEVEFQCAKPANYFIRLPFLTVLEQLSSVKAAVDIVDRKRHARW